MRPNTHLDFPRQAKLRQRGQCLAYKDEDQPACPPSTAMSQCDAHLTENYDVFYNVQLCRDISMKNDYDYMNTSVVSIVLRAVNICIHCFKGEKHSHLCSPLK